MAFDLASIDKLTELKAKANETIKSDTWITDALSDWSGVPAADLEQMAADADGIKFNPAKYLHKASEAIKSDTWITDTISEMSGVSTEDLEQLAADALAKAEQDARESRLKPSPGLFDNTATYTLHDKSHDQLMVDIAAIKNQAQLDRDFVSDIGKFAPRQEDTWMDSVVDALAPVTAVSQGAYNVAKDGWGFIRYLTGTDDCDVQIDLRGKSATEIAQLNHELNRDELERRADASVIANNPIVSRLTKTAAAYTGATDKARDIANGDGTNRIIEFLKDHKGMVGGAGALLMMSMMGGGKNGSLLGGIGKLASMGAFLFVGAQWLYNQQPDTFQSLASSIGIDEYFNTPPTQPMWTGSKKASTITAATTADENKYGKLTAEDSGGIVTDTLPASAQKLVTDQHSMINQVASAPPSVDAASKRSAVR